MLKRPQELAKNIVIIDGLSKSGKSMVCPLVSSLERSELWVADHIFEYLSSIYNLGGIDREPAIALMRLHADLDLYNLRIGRNTNFRSQDDTGAARSFMEDIYKERLLHPGGDPVVDEIAISNPTLVLMTHYIFGMSNLIFEAFGDRLKLYILCRRHPIDLLKGWHEGNWSERIGKDPREFQLSIEYGDNYLPWFTYGWEEKYLEMNPLEKSVASVCFFLEAFRSRMESMDTESLEKVMIIDYDEIIQTPGSVIKGICERINSKQTERTAKVLEYLKIPRRLEPRDKEYADYLVELKAGVSEELFKRFEALLVVKSDGFFQYHECCGLV